MKKVIVFGAVITIAAAVLSHGDHSPHLHVEPRLKVITCSSMSGYGATTTFLN